MSRKFFFKVLLSQMVAQQMGFKEMAAKLKLPESEVQAIFDNQDCSFTCMENMCEVLGIKFQQLLTSVPKPIVLIEHLTQQQEIEILSHKKMCAVVICALNQWGVTDILERVRIEKVELMPILRRLEEMGFLQILPNDEFKLMVSKSFSWLANGPMMHMVQSESVNYFAYSFNKPADVLCLFTAYVTPEMHDKLRLKMQEIANEYLNQTHQQSGIAVKDKMRVTVCIAARDWVPSEMQKLMKVKEGAN